MHRWYTHRLGFRWTQEEADRWERLHAEPALPGGAVQYLRCTGCADRRAVPRDIQDLDLPAYTPPSTEGPA